MSKKCHFKRRKDKGENICKQSAGLKEAHVYSLEPVSVSHGKAIRPQSRGQGEGAGFRVGSKTTRVGESEEGRQRSQPETQ